MAFEYRVVAWSERGKEPQTVWQGEERDYRAMKSALRDAEGRRLFECWAIQVRVSDWEPLDAFVSCAEAFRDDGWTSGSLVALLAWQNGLIEAQVS